jgi:hypothetical protein
MRNIGRKDECAMYAGGSIRIHIRLCIAAASRL